MADESNREKPSSKHSAERDFCETDKTIIRIVSQDETSGKDLAPFVVPDILPIETPSKAIIGTTVAGIAIKSMIGSGGMSCVYRGLQPGLNREVAVKMMHQHLLSDDTALLRFNQEAHAVGKLDHPNIVKVHDFRAGENGNSFLVMDLVEGKPLDELIQEEKRLDPERAIEIFSQACDALEHAHSKGIVHRDLKPSNIMIVKSTNGEDCVKVLDFGIAKILPQEGDKKMKLTQTGEVFGSPLYMSPEQCMGKAIDQRSDIYSLGCLIYESITGKPPFEGANAFDTFFKHTTEMPQSVKDLREDFPMWKEFDAIILKAMAKDPKDRYQSMTKLKIDLNKLRSQSDRGWIGKVADDTELARRRFGAQGKRSIKSIVTQIGLVLIVAGTAGGSWYYFSNVIAMQSQTWDSLYVAGQESFNKGDYSRATQQFEAALAIAKRDYSKVAPILRELVNVQVAQGIAGQSKYELRKEKVDKERDSAITTELDDLTTEFKQTAKSSDPGAKEKLESLAQEISDKGNLLVNPDAETRKHLDSALTTVLSTFEKRDTTSHSTGYARALHNYGVSLHIQSKYKEAIPLFEKSLALKHAINLQDPAMQISYLQTIDALALAYNNSGDTSMAEKTYKKRIDEARKMPGEDNKHSVAANTNVACGKLALAKYYYYSMKDYKAARSNAAEALRIYERSEKPDAKDQAECCALLGQIDLHDGKFESAEEYFLRAYQLFEPMHVRSNLFWIETLKGMAECSFAKNDFKSAEPLYRRCLAVAIEQSPNYAPTVELALKKLDEISTKQGNNKIDDLKALQKMRLRVDITQKGANSNAVVNDYLSLFDFSRAHSEMKDARSYLDQATAVLEKNKDTNSLAAATVLLKRAQFEFDSGNKTQGEALFERLVPVVESLDPKLYKNQSVLTETLAQLKLRMPDEPELANRVETMTKSR